MKNQALTPLVFVSFALALPACQGNDGNDPSPLTCLPPGRPVEFAAPMAEPLLGERSCAVGTRP